MHIIRIPQGSKGFQESLVDRWLTAEGESIRKGQVILEIQTPDTVVQVEAGLNGDATRSSKRPAMVPPRQIFDMGRSPYGKCRFIYRK